ncbi:hypothetical protein D3C80_1170120 [compost metagenome]
MIKLNAVIAQCTRHFERCNNPGNAVKASAFRHGVRMGTEHNNALTDSLAFTQTDQIACRIDAGFKTSRPHTLFQICATFQIKR